MFSPAPESIGLIKSGQTRAIAVTTLERLPMLADIPAIAETLPSFEAGTFQGIAAPAGTPRENVEGIQKETNTALADDEIRNRLLELGGLRSAVGPGQFSAYLRRKMRSGAK